MLHRPRGYSAGEWVARSLINTAARFLLRPLVLFFSITLHSPLTFLSLIFLFLLPFASPRPMSYLANSHRPYDSPDPPSYSHSQLAPQNARNVLNISSFDTLNTQHSAQQSPDQRLPKVGETRCCQYPITYLLHDRSFILLFIPAFFASRAPCALSASPLTSFPFQKRLDSAFRGPQLCLSRPRPVLPSRRSGRPFNRTVLAQVCPPRRTGFRKE